MHELALCTSQTTARTLIMFLTALSHSLIKTKSFVKYFKTGVSKYFKIFTKLKAAAGSTFSRTRRIYLPAKTQTKNQPITVRRLQKYIYVALRDEINYQKCAGAFLQHCIIKKRQTIVRANHGNWLRYHKKLQPVMQELQC